MDRQLAISLAVGAPLLAAAMATAWLQKPARQAALPQAPAPVLEHCHRAAELLYEVSWAAACYALKDENDCMLPEAQAARVNALLAAETARCMAVESAARQ